jgi:hypothetical protein
VAKTMTADRSVLLEDRRMWRLLLARLHPDAGGDSELFLFACAVKEKTVDAECPREKCVGEDGWRRAENVTEPFLRAWQLAMSGWASGNREVLKSFSAR